MYQHVFRVNYPDSIGFPWPQHCVNRNNPVKHYPTTGQSDEGEGRIVVQLNTGTELQRTHFCRYRTTKDIFLVFTHWTTNDTFLSLLNHKRHIFVFTLWTTKDKFCRYSLNYKGHIVVVTHWPTKDTFLSLLTELQRTHFCRYSQGRIETHRKTKTRTLLSEIIEHRNTGTHTHTHTHTHT